MLELQLLKILLKYKTSLKTFFLLSLAQILLGASTIWLVQALKTASNNELKKTLFFLLLFIFSILLALIPQNIAQITINNWKFECFKTFLKHFKSINFKKTLDTQRGCRQEKEPWLTNQGFLIIRDVIDDLTKIFSAILDFTITVWTLGFLVSQKIAFGYLLSGIVVTFILRMTLHHIENATQNMQHKRNILAYSLSNGWDNILIGNKLNYQYWQERNNRKLEEAQKAESQYLSVKILIGWVITFITSILLIFVNIYNFYGNQITQSLIIVTGTMPRQVQGLKSLSNFISVLVSLRANYSRFQGLFKEIQIDRELKDYDKWIHYDEILCFVNGELIHIQSREQFLELILSLKNGKISLRAPNGSGKSLLMGIVAEQTHNRFYLPTTLQKLAFYDVNFNQKTSGEQLIIALESIIKGEEEYDLILLDEWDANLDEVNQIKIEKMINELSQRTVVVESRH